MHDVAASLVRREPRLARELRDVLVIEFPSRSVAEIEELAGIRRADDRSCDSARERRLRGLEIELDAALVDWADDRRPVSTPTTSTGTTPTTSGWRTRTAGLTRRVEGERGSSLGRG